MNRILPHGVIIILIIALNLVSNKTKGQQTYYVDVAGTDAPGANPYATLTYALGDIIHVAGDTIVINNGTYNDLNIALNLDDIYIKGSALGTAIFDGGNTGMFMTITGSNVHIDDLLIQNYTNSGGVDIISNSTLDSTYVYFNRCGFLNNETNVPFDAKPHGGGMYIETGSGAGILPAVVTLVDCQFVGNIAEDSEGGGAIYIRGNSRLDVTGSRFLCNNPQVAGLTTYEGGAIYVSNSRASFRESFFSGNSVFDQQGGAIIGDDATGQRFINIESSVFTDNLGREGSAIFVYDNFDLNIVNSLFYDNETRTGFGNGGVINSSGGNNNVTIINSTIADNTRGSGTDSRGVVNSSSNTFVIENSLIWGNANEDVEDVGAGTVDVSYSVVDPAGTPSYNNVVGNSTVNPNFTGGTDYTVQAASVAIGLGLGGSEPTDDIVGTVRSNNTSGAFEFGSSSQTYDLACNVILPCVAEAGSTVTICSGDSIQIGGSPSASGGNGSSFAYAWLPATNIDDPTISNPTVFPTNTTTYYLTIDNGSCNVVDSIVVNVTPRPVADAGDVSYTICLGDSVQIGTANTAGVTYTWTPSTGLTDPSISNPIAFPTDTTVYYLSVTENGCASASPDSTTVNVTPRPVADAGDVSYTICLGDSVQIGTANTAGVTYTWTPSTGLTDPSISNPIAFPTDTTVYYLSVTENGCASASPDSTTVNVTPRPVADAGDVSYTICLGDSVQIGTANTAGVTYTWTPSTGLTDPSISNPIAFPTDTTVYYLSVTENGCASASPDSTTVNVTPRPVADAGDVSYTICLGDSVQIGTANTAGVTYTWTPSTGLTDPSISNPIAFPTDTTVYYLSVTENGCASASPDSTTVNVTPRPVADAGDVSYTICLGDSVQIGTANTAGVTYTWTPSTGLTDPSISNPIAFPTDTTVYYLSVTENECASASPDSTTVNVTPRPVADAGDVSYTICLGDSVQIGTANTAGVTYTWTPSTGLTDPSISNPIAFPTDTTVYYLSVTENGCASASPDSTTVNVTPRPVADAGDVSYTICLGDSVQIGTSNTAGVTYTWTPSTGLTDPSISNPIAFPTDTTVYYLSVTENGCTSASPDSTTVNVTPRPVADAGDINYTICSGDSVQLGVASISGVSYSWTPTTNMINPTASNPIVFPTDTITYYLTASQNGCSAMDSVVVNSNELPQIDATGIVIQDANCGNTNGSITGLVASGFPVLTYEWESAGLVVSNDIDLLNQSSGSYSLTITDGNTCTNTFGPYNINDIGGATLDITAVTIVPDTCGKSVGSITGVVVTGGAGTLTYVWTDGVDTLGTTVDLINVPAGNYTLIVSDSAGCNSVTGPFTLNEIAGPSIDETLVLINDDHCSQSIGAITGLQTSGGNGTISYSWNNGSIEVGTSLDLNNIPSGTYYLTITDESGCQAVGSSYDVLDISGPVLDTSGVIVDLASCGGSNGQITNVSASGGVTPYTWQWYDGTTLVGTNQDLTGVPSGSYSIVVTDSAGCTDSLGVINVSNASAPIIDVTGINISDASCGASNGSITGISASGGTLPYTYSWNDGTTEVSTTLDLINVPMGDYTLTVTDSNGCASQVGPFNINQGNAPTIDVSGAVVTDANCGLSNGSITGILVNGGTTPYTYSWSNGTTQVSDSLDLLLVGAGTYTLTVTDSAGCQSVSSPFNISDNVVIIDLSNVVTVNPSCNLNNGQISNALVSGGTQPYTYSWFLGGVLISNNLDINLLTDGWYTLQVTDSLGCSATDSLYLNRDAVNNITAQDDYYTTEQNNSVPIDPLLNDAGATNYTVLVDPVNGVVSGSSYLPNFNFVGLDSLTYEICDPVCVDVCDTAMVYIEVTRERKIKIYDGFSPNGDGSNETFYIENIEFYPENEVLIYSRWGELVYSAQPYNNEWDGTSKTEGVKLVGNKVVDGTYYFILKLTPDSEAINGFIDLRR